MAGGKTESSPITLSCTTMLICTITLLLLFFLSRVESHALADLTSPSLSGELSFLTESVFTSHWISAADLQKELLQFSYLLVGFVFGYFPLQWISKYLDESEYFGSNFQ